MTTPYSHAFLKAMPKADLHLHLDGSLRPDGLIEMAKRSGIELPSYTVEGLYDLVFKESYQNLGEYLNGFQYTCAVLRDMENLEQTVVPIVHSYKHNWQQKQGNTREDLTSLMKRLLWDKPSNAYRN